MAKYQPMKKGGLERAIAFVLICCDTFMGVSMLCITTYFKDDIQDQGPVIEAVRKYLEECAGGEVNVVYVGKGSLIVTCCLDVGAWIFDKVCGVLVEKYVTKKFESIQAYVNSKRNVQGGFRPDRTEGVIVEGEAESVLPNPTTQAGQVDMQKAIESLVILNAGLNDRMKNLGLPGPNAIRMFDAAELSRGGNINCISLINKPDANVDIEIARHDCESFAQTYLGPNWLIN